MAKRSQSKDQLSLFDTLEPPPLPPVFIPVIRQRTMTYYEGLIATIARDMETLRMDPVFWSPSREFYEERIVNFREEARRVLQRKERNALDGDNTMQFEKEQNRVRYG